MQETPEQTVERLRRNKRLLDDVHVAQGRIHLERARRAQPDIWSNPSPLVTVRILTYNRPQQIVDRAIASVLKQTYQNFEILVVGDHAVPETEAALQAVGDPRIRYYNLPERPKYPQFPRFFWSSAGGHASYRSYDLMHGDWITWLDDDDEYPEDHIALLLEAAYANRVEMVYGQAEYENPDGSWILVGNGRLACGQICSGAALYSNRLLGLRPDPYSWILDEPGDWNLWKRMAQMGATIGFLDRVVFRHYAESTMVEDAVERQRLQVRVPTAREILDDMAHTGAGHLLDLA
jgi:glycosyltransferase involved in cell wall biosynthesis